MNYVLSEMLDVLCISGVMYVFTGMHITLLLTICIHFTKSDSTLDVVPMLFQCWASISDVSQTLRQYRPACIIILFAVV